MNMTIPSYKSMLAALALLGASVTSNHAALLLYDGFESYTTGLGINTQNGGTASGGATWSAWSTASAGQTTQAVSLSYSGGSVSVGGGTKVLQSNAGSLTWLTLRNYTIPAVADGSSVYVSYLMQAVSGFSGADTFTQVGIYPSTSWGTVTQLTAGSTDVGVRAGSGSFVGGPSTESLTNGTTYFVVQQYTISGANTTVSTWLNPTSLTLGTATASGTAATGAMTFTSLRFRGATGIGTYLYDEVRIGTSVADVVPVPEPQVFALLAIAGLFSMRCFRRRAHR